MNSIRSQSIGTEGVTKVRFLAAVSLLFFLLAGVLSAVRPPLVDPDEGRNAEVARETLAGGGWIVPSFHGLPYLDKPALFFDLVALGFRVLGRSEFVARLPSILFALGTLGLTWVLALDRLGVRRACGAVAILASAPLFLVFARTVIFDMGLTFFVTLAIWFAQAGCRGWRWGGVLAWISIALAVLTKGPVGLLLPILGTVALTLGSERPYRLGRFFHPLGLAAFAVCIVPWLWAVETREPGFLRYALLVETLERLTAPTFHRTGPIWYYAPILFLGLFPWSVAALASLPRWIREASRGALGRPSANRGLILAFAAFFVFFSLSRSKLGGYILPALPMAAILLAEDLAEPRRHSQVWFFVTAAILIAFGLASIVVSGSPHLLEAWTRQPAGPAAMVARVVLSIGVVSLAIGALLATSKKIRVWTPFLLAAAFPVIVLLSLPSIVRYSEESSSKGIATFVLKHGGEPVAIHSFPTGLDYYLNRIVPVVTESGREITSTYVARNYSRIVESGGTPSLWSSKDLEEKLKDAAPGDHILITRRDDPPAPGFRIVQRFGRYRIWASTAPTTGKP